jgi:hypothetical protein
MGPEFYGLKFFLSQTSLETSMNKLPVQSVFSELCGYYCVLFILIRSRNISFARFLKYFDVDTLKNDNKIFK